MTTFATDANLSAAISVWGGRVAASADELIRRLAEWNDARVTRRMLSRLSARQLDDVGLCRADIEAVATRTAR